MNPIGIMQGRLSPPGGGRIQSFPKATWRDEFALARACGLDRIEWILEAEGWAVNPLMTDAGLREIRRLVEATGVGVRSVCADYFLDRPLVRADSGALEERLGILERIMQRAALLGAEHVDLPFVDASRIEDEGQAEAVAVAIRSRVRVLERTGVRICLETSLPPTAFRALLERIDHALVGANHDIGNSAALGYLAAEELGSIGRWVWCVHVKDRARGGGTVPLGFGCADFRASFWELARTPYSGALILQVARGADGDEVGWARQNVAFVKRCLERPVTGLEAVKGGGTQP